MERKPWPCIQCLVMMELVNDDYCKCPVCGTEVWFNFNAPKGDEITELMRDKLKTHKSREDIPLTGKGGHSKSRSKSGRKRKKPPKKLRCDLWGI